MRGFQGLEMCEAYLVLEDIAGSAPSISSAWGSEQWLLHLHQHLPPLYRWKPIIRQLLDLLPGGVVLHQVLEGSLLSYVFNIEIALWRCNLLHNNNNQFLVKDFYVSLKGILLYSYFVKRILTLFLLVINKLLKGFVLDSYWSLRSCWKDSYLILTVH